MKSFIFLVVLGALIFSFRGTIFSKLNFGDSSKAKQKESQGYQYASKPELTSQINRYSNNARQAFARYRNDFNALMKNTGAGYLTARDRIRDSRFFSKDSAGYLMKQERMNNKNIFSSSNRNSSENILSQQRKENDRLAKIVSQEFSKQRYGVEADMRALRNSGAGYITAKDKIQDARLTKNNSAAASFKQQQYENAKALSSNSAGNELARQRMSFSREFDGF